MTEARFSWRYFHRFGPLAWYHDEWFRIDLRLLGRHWGFAWSRITHELTVVAGCRAIGVTFFDLPVIFAGGLHFTL